MRLSRIEIQNFKGIHDLSLDFTDSLGKPVDLAAIVGPNGSGKTTILDAIWYGLMSQIGYKALRNNFREETDYIVRSGERFAKVIYHFEISEDEQDLIDFWKEKLLENDAIKDHIFPRSKEGKIEWTYPAQPGYEERRQGQGGYRMENFDWILLKGKEYASRLNAIDARRPADARRVGGIYLFAQERRLITSPIYQVDVSQNDNEDDNEFNIRQFLINIGLKERVRRENASQTDGWYSQIQTAFNAICAPHTMQDIVSMGGVDSEYNIEFRDGNSVAYYFDGLSSGQVSVLLFLAKFFSRQINHSIVLIDEIELHLHPTWQKRLLANLNLLNTNNQFIITTHSPTILQFMPEEQIIDLGHLNEDITIDWVVPEEDLES